MSMVKIRFGFWDKVAATATVIVCTGFLLQHLHRIWIRNQNRKHATSAAEVLQLVGSKFKADSVDGLYPGSLKVVHWSSRVFLIELGCCIDEKLRVLVKEVMKNLRTAKGQRLRKKMLTFCAIFQLKNNNLELRNMLVSVSGAANPPTINIAEQQVSISNLNLGTPVTLVPFASDWEINAQPGDPNRVVSRMEERGVLIRLLSDMRIWSLEEQDPWHEWADRLRMPVQQFRDWYSSWKEFSTAQEVQNKYTEHVAGLGAGDAKPEKTVFFLMLFGFHSRLATEPKLEKKLSDRLLGPYEEMASVLSDELKVKVENMTKFLRYWSEACEEPSWVHNAASAIAHCSEDHLWEYLCAHQDLLPEPDHVHVIFSIQSRKDREETPKFDNRLENGSIEPPCAACHAHIHDHVQICYRSKLPDVFNRMVEGHARSTWLDDRMQQHQGEFIVLLNPAGGFSWYFSSSSCSFPFSPPSASGEPAQFTMVIKNPATGEEMVKVPITAVNEFKSPPNITVNMTALNMLFRDIRE